MAKRTGQFAKVSMDVNGNEVDVMELREWSVSFSTEKIDSNVAGDKWSDHMIGMASWEGEATCISADQYWLKMLTEKLTVNFFDHVDDVEPAYTGTASVDFERSAPYDDIIESTLTFTGAGELASPKEATPAS